jgi:MFS family permease
MDTMGAVLGPLCSLVYLYIFPGNYKTLFLIAFVPGSIAILFTLITKEKTIATKPSKSKFKFWGFLAYWKESDAVYKRVVGGMLVFALVNSSDMFLLLRLKDSGCKDTVVIGLYIFYNLIYALASYPLGYLGDKLGLKGTFTFGLLLFAIVYVGMGLTSNLYISIGLFVVYGLYAAATDGISKAWISNISKKKDTATALGSFAGYQSICALLASSITGIMWRFGGSKIPFLFTGSVTIILFMYFALMPTLTKVEDGA